MKIALVGYGKMGKAIESIALERGHTISARINSANLQDWNLLNTGNTDVVIEFSLPNSVFENIEKCFEKRLPMVVGTTGWYKQMEEIKKKVISEGHSFVYASNFSVGMNLFFSLNKWLINLMASYPQYRPNITETHHIHKLDAPSGTAISLANDIIEADSRYKSWKLDSNKPEGELNISAIRVNEVPGTHVVSYLSENDEIEIRHVAKSRMGFASGAVIAAEWIGDKKGFFNMSDVLGVK